MRFAHSATNMKSQRRQRILAAGCFALVFALSNLRLASQQTNVHNVDDSSFQAPSTHRYPSAKDVKSSLTITNHTVLCRDCRYDPSGMGATTCLDRAQYLVDRYQVPMHEAMDKIMGGQPRCIMRHFNVSYSSKQTIEDVLGMNGDGKSESIFDVPRHSQGRIPSSHVSGLSIYFYDNIPNEFGEGLEQSMMQQYANSTFTYENFKADLAIIDLFRTYPGRTYNPLEADLLIVPYPHGSHCLLQSRISNLWLNGCMQVSESEIQRNVLDKLSYYKGNEKKHLFVNSMEIWLAHPILRHAPLSLSMGPRLLSEDGHQIVVPYLNDQSAFQPSFIQKRTSQWWTRPRKYSVVYYFGSSNKRMRNSARVYRQQFLEEVRSTWTLSPYVGDLPYVVQTLEKDNSPSSEFFTEMYSGSVFCPTLPGDAPSQKRFFDVILVGCLPVVLSFDTEMPSVSKKSWHSPNGFPIEDSYPWIKGSSSIQQEHEIDYESFVVQVEGGVENVKPVLETLLKNSTEIERRQVLMMKYASYFSYGMGTDSHVYEDAFAKTLQSIRYYLDHYLTPEVS
eukprot:g13945.t1 g13945   contig9:793464-795238(+)